MNVKGLSQPVGSEMATKENIMIEAADSGACETQEKKEQDSSARETVNELGKLDTQEKEVDEPSEQERLFQEIDKLDKDKLPPELQSLDVDAVKEVFKKATSISILVTGKTGSGKSTLTNGILGLQVKKKQSPAAKEGSDIKTCTTDVTKYQKKVGKINVTVWDSPGLQDGTEDQKKYLQQLQEQCSKRDLTVYCIRLLDIRFVRGEDNPDVIAMKKLTEIFGNEFWSNAIIVLTFANILEALNFEWKRLLPDDKAKAFTAKIERWEKQIKEILIVDVQVPEAIIKSITIIPAGHYEEPHLPGRRHWLSTLWWYSLGTIAIPEKQAALVELNLKRFKREVDVTEEDFKKPPEEQPIIVDGDAVSVLKFSGKVSAGVVIGAAVGAAVGLVGGPAMPILTPLGAVIGSVIGGTIAAAIAKILSR